jgi:hypothetical protein
MAKKWQFVSNHTDDGAGKDAETRRIVRKAAMRAFRQNQRLEQAKKFMQEQPENDDQHDPQFLDNSSENSLCRIAPASSDDVERRESPVLGQDKNSVESKVVSSRSLALAQPGSWSEYPMASGFRWPQEITSLDPFGSSPLGTCSTWHYLFRHCESPLLFSPDSKTAAVPG